MKTKTHLIFFGQVISGVLGLASATLTAKYVGALTFSICSSAILVSMALMSLMDFGSCSWVTRELAAKTVSFSEYFGIMQKKLRLSLSLVLLAPATIFFFQGSQRWITLLLLYPYLWSKYNYIQQYLISIQSVNESVKLVVIERIFWLLIVPFQIIGLDPYLAFIAPIILGLYFHQLLGMKYFRRHGSYLDIKCRYSQLELFRKSKYFGISSVLSVFSNLDGVVVTAIVGPSFSGTYLFAQRFRTPLTLVFNSLSMGIKPIAATKKTDKILQAIKSDAVFLGLSMLTNLTFSIILLSGLFTPLDGQFKAFEEVMFFGTLTSIPLGIVLLSTNIFNGIGCESLTLRLSAFQLFSNFIGIAIFSHYHGILGAVIFSFILNLLFACICLVLLIFVLKGYSISPKIVGKTFKLEK